MWPQVLLPPGNFNFDCYYRSPTPHTHTVGCANFQRFHGEKNMWGEPEMPTVQLHVALGRLLLLRHIKAEHLYARILKTVFFRFCCR